MVSPIDVAQIEGVRVPGDHGQSALGSRYARDVIRDPDRGRAGGAPHTVVVVVVRGPSISPTGSDGRSVPTDHRHGLGRPAGRRHVDCRSRAPGTVSHTRHDHMIGAGQSGRRVESAAVHAADTPGLVDLPCHPRVGRACHACDELLRAVSREPDCRRRDGHRDRRQWRWRSRRKRIAAAPDGSARDQCRRGTAIERRSRTHSWLCSHAWSLIIRLFAALPGAPTLRCLRPPGVGIMNRPHISLAFGPALAGRSHILDAAVDCAGRLSPPRRHARSAPARPRAPRDPHPPLQPAHREGVCIQRLTRPQDSRRRSPSAPDSPGYTDGCDALRSRHG